MPRMAKGKSEPLILKTLLNNSLTIAQIERKSKIKKPTLYLTINRLHRKGLVKSGKEKRNRKWSLTPRGRIVAKKRIMGERIIARILNTLRKALSLGITMREIERMVLSKK